MEPGSGSAFAASIAEVSYRATKTVAVSADPAMSVVCSVHSARYPS